MDTPDRLESWKEIAAYLKRDVRTVQRWEAFESLPVHRHQHKKRGSVYALKGELDAWRESRRAELFNTPDVNGTAPVDTGVPADPAPAPSRFPRWPWVAGAITLAAVTLAAVWTREPSAPGTLMIDPGVTWDATRLFGEALRDGGTLDRIPIGGNGGDVALSPDGQTIYASLCSPGRPAMEAIDVRTRAVKWRSGGLDGCTLLKVSPQGDRVFLADRTDVIVIDTKTQNVQRIRTPAASLLDFAVTPDGRTLYAAAAFNGLLAIDLATGKVDTLSRLPCPVRVALTPAGDRLYVAYQCSGPGGSRGHDSIDVIETRSNRSIAVINGLANVGGDIEVMNDGSHLWADGADACRSPYYDHVGCPPGLGAIVHVIRTSDHLPLRSLRIGPEGEFSTRLSFSPDGTRVVVGSSRTTVVSTASLTEAEFSPLPVWGNVAFSRDGRAAYAVYGPDQKAISVFPIVPHPAPAPGLTARWTMDGNGTDLAAGNDVGPFAPEAFAPGRVGLALSFVDRPPVRLGRPSNIAIDSGFVTAMAWVKFDPAGPAQGAMSILEYAASDTAGPSGWRMFRHADSRAALCLGSHESECVGPRATLIRGQTVLAAGSWHHVAFTKDGERVALYVNGRLEGTGTFTGGMPNLENHWLRLGSGEAGTSPLRGRLDEVEIYNRPLTPKEVIERGK